MTEARSSASHVQKPLASLQRTTRMAARALARTGLVGAFGHCSARLDDDILLVCAPKPMATIGVGEPGRVVPIYGPLPPGVLGEVRIHQHIYRARPEVGGVCRVLPHAVGALAALGLTPRPLTGSGAYFAPAPPLHDSPLLARTDSIAGQIAATLGPANAVVMRGNGAVTVGDTLQRATVLAWFLEDAARTDLLVRQIPGASARVFDADEVQARNIWSGGIEERLWLFLTADDPEHLGDGRNAGFGQ